MERLEVVVPGSGQNSWAPVRWANAKGFCLRIPVKGTAHMLLTGASACRRRVRGTKGERWQYQKQQRGRERTQLCKCGLPLPCEAPNPCKSNPWRESPLPHFHRFDCLGTSANPSGDVPANRSRHSYCSPARVAIIHETVHLKPMDYGCISGSSCFELQ